MNAELLISYLPQVSIAVIGFAFLRRIANSYIIGLHGGRIIERTEHQWIGFYSKLDRLTTRAQIPTPKVILLEEYSPNCYAVARMNRSLSTIVITEGLVQLLSNEELESVLALCIAQLKLREFRRASLVAACLLPWERIVDRLPHAMGILIQPFLAIIVRILVTPKRIYRADNYAVRLAHSPSVLAGALRKIESGARQVPMVEQRVSIDHLYVIPTLSEGNLLRYFPTHPDISERIKRLLSQSITC